MLSTAEGVLHGGRTRAPRQSGSSAWPTTRLRPRRRAGLMGSMPWREQEVPLLVPGPAAALCPPSRSRPTSSLSSAAGHRPSSSRRAAQRGGMSCGRRASIGKGSSVRWPAQLRVGIGDLEDGAFGWSRPPGVHVRQAVPTAPPHCARQVATTGTPKAGETAAQGPADMPLSARLVHQINADHDTRS